ncbi:MAG: TM2 domain-containing protein [Bacteroidales bacterium]|nr:TM2 domain-containing protein [Bacteroidales bacterium]
MKNFSPSQISDIKTKLSALPEEKSMVIMSLDFRDTTTILLLSLFFGGWGVDRFLVGDVGIGILKLLTGGCCGILWLIDLINHKKMTHNYNYKKFIEAIAVL